MTEDPKREPADPSRNDDAPPHAGPHAEPELTDPNKTPGTGVLPSDGTEADDATEAPTG